MVELFGCANLRDEQCIYNAKVCIEARAAREDVTQYDE
jgi:hypothetical protein